MKVDLGIWHKLTRLVVVAIGLTALTGLVYWVRAFDPDE